MASDNERFPGMDPAETYRAEANVLLDEALRAWGNCDDEAFARLFFETTDAETKAEEFDLNLESADIEDTIRMFVKLLEDDPREIIIPDRHESESAEDYLVRLIAEIKSYPESGEQ